MNRFSSRRGFTLVELAIALVLFSVISSSLIVGMAQQQRFRRQSEHRSIAQIIARNEIEILRAAGPGSGATPIDTREVNSAGEQVPNGDYTVIVSTEVICVGGEGNLEDPNQTILGACPNGRNGVLRYQIKVRYPTAVGLDSIRYQLDLSERGRFGEARAID